MEKSKKIYFENLPKATMQREINEFLMSNGLSPFTALDRSNKSDLLDLSNAVNGVNPFAIRNSLISRCIVALGKFSKYIFFDFSIIYLVNIFNL